MKIIHHPILCNYYLTYRCNAKCGFCDIWEIPSPYVKDKDVKDNLYALKELGVSVIDFTGGEPLLHQKLPQYLQWAKELGFITTVTTNALLYPKQAENLKGKVDMLHFSLDAATKEGHDNSRGVFCWDHVMESIAVARELGERPDIIFTVFPHNLHEVQQVYDEICVPNELVLILNPVFNYADIKFQDFTEDQLRGLTKYGGMERVYLNDAFLTLRKNKGNQIDDPICKAASSTVVISPMNELVLPCYHLGLKKKPIEGSLKSVYGSEEVQSFIKNEGRFPECDGCTINCYMQPSFSMNLNEYWLHALPSTLKYNFLKGTWKQLFKVS